MQYCMYIGQDRVARKTKADAELTRQNILDAAERLFFIHGVTKTSLEEIAAEAGVTRGAIYWHFADKGALFRDLHERVRLPQEDMVRQVVAEGHPDPLGFMEQIALHYIRTVSADARLMRVYAILLVRCEYVGEMADALTRQHDANTAMRENLKRIFAMAAENGSLNAKWTPGTAARVFETMMSGLWADWLRYGQEFDMAVEGADCVRELFTAFRGQ